VNGRKFILQLILPSLLILTFFGAIGRGGIIMPFHALDSWNYPEDSTNKDSLILKYPIRDRKGDFITDEENNPFNLEDPDVIEQDVDYDPLTNEFIITETIGEDYYRNPNYLSFEEFLKQEFGNSQNEYWKQRARTESRLERKGIVPKLHVKSNILDRIFGGSTVDIKPQGTINLTFGGQFTRYDNPLLSEKQKRTGGFDFDMNIQMNVVGKIGEKLKVTTNYNTQATFDFENQFKLEYTGFEDEIIQKIEAGNVSLPLRGTLITGSQSLFGIKTELQFGRLSVTSIFTQQKGEVKEIEIQGGAQTETFNIEANQYDANRHFFLSQFFRDNYDKALKNLPIINSPISINRIEVWVTNFSGATENTRNIVAFMDLGEGLDTNIYNPTITDGAGIQPHNDANNLYKELKPEDPTKRNNNTIIQTLLDPSFKISLETPRDFEKIYARRLSESEYTFNQQQRSLGYISLNQSLNPEEVLAVAFQYVTTTGEVFTVGEFSEDVLPGENSSSVIFVKMLKSSSANTKYPIWDLMMKNIYSLGAYQVNSEDFQLDVNYTDPGGGERRYIPEGAGVKGIPLIRLLNLDRLNSQQDAMPDGVFDYVSGITISPSNGRVIFPVVEPFGSYLMSKFDTANANEKKIADKYVYSQLYDSTITIAEQFPELNRYTLQGSYKSSVSSEISLGFNISPGSVKLTAGGQQLSEGNDYIRGLLFG